ncbi:MAG TPA: hypothetical protein PK829_04585 [Promineifilum sp.]|nr:hypothetical protein [Promineifilum sp.]
MGPLVYYCRWRGVQLRLRGRDESAVWGQLVERRREDGRERAEPFRFDLRTWELWLGEPPGRRLQLDELGVVESEEPSPDVSSSADDWPRTRWEDSSDVSTDS